MRKDFEKLYIYADRPEAPLDLLEKITKRISWEREMRRIKRRIFLFSFFSFASFVFLAIAFRSTAQETYESGLAQIFSVLLYNPGLISSMWNQFAISLLEALPAVKITLSLAAVLALLESLKYLARDINLIVSAPKFKLTA